MLILIYDAVGLPTSHPSFLLGHQKSGWTDPFHRNEWIGWEHPYHARGSRQVVATATTPGMFTATAQAPTQPPPALPAPAPATTNATSTSNATSTTPSTTPSTTSTTPATASGATTSKDAASCSTNSAANASTFAAGPSARTSAAATSANTYAAATSAKTEGATTNGTKGSAARPPACAACRSQDVPPANTRGGDDWRRWGNLFCPYQFSRHQFVHQVVCRNKPPFERDSSCLRKEGFIWCECLVHDVICTSHKSGCVLVLLSKEIQKDSGQIYLCLAFEINFNAEVSRRVLFLTPSSCRSTWCLPKETSSVRALSGRSDFEQRRMPSPPERDEEQRNRMELWKCLIQCLFVFMVGGWVWVW